MNLKPPIAIVCAIAALCSPVWCQDKRSASKEKVLQFSMAPGWSTNGLQPGDFINYFSFNLSSGYSASNRVFELALISNLNTDYTRGLQLAGLCNFTGANAYGGLSAKVADEKEKSGFASILEGAQFSGLLNFTMDGTFGAQTSGAFNVTRGPLLGVQIGGIANIVHKYSFGMQVGGVMNISHTSMDGVQLAGLVNYTSGGLFGMQVGAINRAMFTEGKNSAADAGHGGIQIGIFNSIDRVNGFQIGLVNWSRQSQGTQIGLINFYKPSNRTGTRDGTAIGLLNIGDFGFLAVSATEVFATQYELATGNRKNGRIMLASQNKYVENVLSYANHAFRGDSWAFGYGIQKMHFNRSTAPGMTEFRFVAYGVHIHQINPVAGKLHRQVNMLSQVKLSAGTRLSPKLYNVYAFAALTGNLFRGEADDWVPQRVMIQRDRAVLWPGLSAGVMLH